MPKGGKRPGAGRPKGAKDAVTYTKVAVAKAIHQRVMQNADKIVNAQLTKALGSVMVFEVVEVKGKDGKPKVEHVLVRDPDKIKAVLDTGEGVNCSVEGSFYLVTEVPPETKAGDSLLDRTFGKAQQSIEVITNPVDKVLEAYNLWLADNPKASIKDKALWIDRFAKSGGVEVEVLAERAGVQVLNTLQ
jgi:hypothetical protein